MMETMRPPSPKLMMQGPKEVRRSSMKTLMSGVLLIAALIVAPLAQATPCVVSDVTVEGSAANACAGMFDGNVNSLADVNAALGTSFDEFINAETLGVTVGGVTFNADGTLTFEDWFGDTVAIALKQNTHWAVFMVDLTSRTIGLDGLWNGTWSTSGMQWDNKPDTPRCEGCGGLSHGILVSYKEHEVPAPLSVGLLGLSLLALSLVRRR